LVAVFADWKLAVTMSAGKTDTPGGWKPSTAVISLLIVLGVFGGMLLVRHLGLLQFLEFQAYDFFIRQQPKAPPNDPIVLVEMTEEDIQDPSLDYPIYDSKLAELLRILIAAGPDCIGLDIWRDIPVPKSGSGLAALNEVLLTNGNICAIFTLGDEHTQGIKPPPVLEAREDRMERLGFNDNFPVDVAVDATIPKVRRSNLEAKVKKVRRSNLEAKENNESYLSLPFWLALHYLQTRNVEVDKDPGNTWLRLGKTVVRRFGPNDGAYIDADHRGFQMLLDFKRSRDFQRFTVMQALTGKIPVEALKDKIVIIGINTPSVSDIRVTPVSRDHRGIEVQAATVNQLLRIALKGDQPLRVLPDWKEDLWILLWCIVGGFVGYRVQSPWRFVLDSLFWIIGIGASAWVAFSNGWWIPIATPAIAFVPASVLVTTYITAQERVMRAMMMKLYSRHVSKEIAESTWENRDSFLTGGRPRPQKLMITVLFTDLKGFSAISEKMAPTELYSWLNDYHGDMAEIVMRHGGYLKQFTGDGMLVIYGAPVPSTQPEQQAADATNAVKSALAMGRRMMELSKIWQAEGLPQVSMRVGIYTGEAAAGNIGDDERYEYAVIGDVVNTASRLESYDKNFADPDKLPNRCRILIGEPTHALLVEGTFISKEIGLLEVKGKARKVSVYQILDEKTQTAPANSMPAPVTV
jgi:adenylate cyclase